MRVLFSHDSLLRKDSSNNYYSTTLNNNAFMRYFDIADEISIVMRAKLFDDDLEAHKYSEITLKNLRIIEAPSITSIKGLLGDKEKAAQIIKKEMLNSDFVVVRLPSFMGMLTFNIARELNKPCLVEMVGCAWDAYWNHSLQGKFIGPYMFKQTRQIVKKATHVVYVTNEFLQNRYPTNGKSISASNVVLNEFHDEILNKRLDKISLKSKEDKIIIGTTGAVNVKYKGQQYVIEALGKLKSQGINNFEYHLVGNGDQSYLRKVAIKYNVEEEVKFIGTLKHNQVFSWLDTLDLYVQPSRQEGLPRGLIEAMSRGLPAFGANTAGIPELLEEDYIFSNTNNNINEISKILLSFQIETMNNQALRNYNESKKYGKSIIEKRRKAFFENFKRESLY